MANPIAAVKTILDRLPLAEMLAADPRLNVIPVELVKLGLFRMITEQAVSLQFDFAGATVTCRLAWIIDPKDYVPRAPFDLEDTGSVDISLAEFRALFPNAPVPTLH